MSEWYLNIRQPIAQRFRKLACLLLAAVFVPGTLAGCGLSDGSTMGGDLTPQDAEDEEEERSDGNVARKDDVTLTVWGAAEDQDILQEMIDAFMVEYEETANWKINLAECVPKEASEWVLKDVPSAADVYMFTSDQIAVLYEGFALQEVSLNADKIMEADGGVNAAAVKAATINNRLYAYPLTAADTALLYYNKEYLEEKEAQRLDMVLQKAAETGKYAVLDLSEDEYVFSFFGGAGFEPERNTDGTGSIDIAGTSATGFEGAEVLNAMRELFADPGLKSMDHAGMLSEIADGSVLAAVGKKEDEEQVREAWGDDFGATQLPAYSCKGRQLVLTSFANYKMLGINPYSQNAGYGMMLAEYLTNEENQQLWFEKKHAAPVNKVTASLPEVQSDEVLRACKAQESYSIPDGCQPDGFSKAMQMIGAYCINPDASEPQAILDAAAAEISNEGK